MFTEIPGSFAEKVLCSISEPALIFDEDLLICWVNPAAEIYFGHSSEFIHGKKCTQLFQEHAECMARCPVAKALETGLEQVLAVNSVANPHKLIEAIPCGTENTIFILALIHSRPENDRRKALKRELAAILNSSATLDEASDDILNAMQNLAYVSRRGIYTVTDQGFQLVGGNDVPGFLPSDITDLCSGNEPLFISLDKMPPELVRSFPLGGAFFPLENGRVILAAGRGNWGGESLSMLELITDVLNECIGRLTAGAFSTQ